MMQQSVFYKSPIGYLKVSSEDDSIVSADFVDRAPRNRQVINGVLKECVKQLDEYFDGNRKVFDLKLKLNGTPFQKKVWSQLQKISHGETKSYQDIARKVGDVKAVRAIGMANNRNCITVIVPCHRVIMKDGSLGGYGGKVWRKKWLLEHEGAI